MSAAIARLPEEYRTVILLRDLEDLSISEVAMRLGLTIPAVKTRQRRARQKVARFLDPSMKFQPRVALAEDCPELRRSAISTAPPNHIGTS